MGDRPAIHRVGLVVHMGRPAAVDAARGVTQWLEAHAVETRELLDGDPTEGPPLSARTIDPEVLAGLDLVVSVGGDGTLLRASRLAAAAGIPVLGLKVGRLGFLTEVEPGEATDLLGEILEGKMVTEDRWPVVAHPIGAPWDEPQWALNEIIVEKSSR